MTQKRKRADKFVYSGLGFPVELRHVALVKSRDTWTPDVNLNDLSAAVFQALALKPANLTGNEVHFLRQRMRMNLQAFAQHFHVTHPAVMKWENAYHKPTGMSWGTELSIRLKTLKDSGLTPTQFFEAHTTLDTLALDPPEKVVIVYDPKDPDFAPVGFDTAATTRGTARRAPHFKSGR